MGGPTNQRIVDNGADWMRQQEKRVMREERRPKVSRASDIMGPGLAPTAVEVTDWSADETEFNGFFFSRPGAANAPDGTSWWIGQCIAQAGGFGIQTVWDYRGVSNPPTTYTRRFTLSGGIRVFSPWA